MITKVEHFEIPVSAIRHGLSIIVIVAVGPYVPRITIALNLV